jgi:hypothetical protein
MDGEHLDADFPPRSVRLAERMGSKPYRHAYVASNTRQFLARQMREFRGDLPQTEFGNRIGKRQTVISRLEDPNYGKWTLQTLFEVAGQLDIAVLVRFVDFPTFLKSTRDMSESAARPVSFNQDAVDEVAREDKQAAKESALMALFSDIPGQQLGLSVLNQSPSQQGTVVPPVTFGQITPSGHPANDVAAFRPDESRARPISALAGNR